MSEYLHSPLKKLYHFNSPVDLCSKGVKQIQSYYKSILVFWCHSVAVNLSQFLNSKSINILTAEVIFFTTSKPFLLKLTTIPIKKKKKLVNFANTIWGGGGCLKVCIEDSLFHETAYLILRFCCLVSYCENIKLKTSIAQFKNMQGVLLTILCWYIKS